MTDDYDVDELSKIINFCLGEQDKIILDEEDLGENYPTNSYLDERLIQMIQRKIVYRVAVVGFNQATERVHRRLKEDLDDEYLSSEFNFYAKYMVQYFGGSGDKDLGIIGTRLNLFKPNYLVAVNSGREIGRIHEITVPELVQFTYAINHELGEGNPGAFEGQKPYTLVFLTDGLVLQKTFQEYQLLCQKRGEQYAKRQFPASRVDLLTEDIRFTFRNYCEGKFAFAEAET